MSALKDLGWDSYFAAHFQELGKSGLFPARVIEELRGVYRLRAGERECFGEASGKLRFDAQNRGQFPAVGDWVAVAQSLHGQTRIEAVLPRKSKLSRKVAGRETAEQIVAANVDIVFVVTALNREFNERRVERYLALVWEAGATPVILLNKADLCPHAPEYLEQMERIAPFVTTHLLSATGGIGIGKLRGHLQAGKTAAMVGSSGVGKSTIINALSGQDSLSVQPVRARDDRGQHTTTTRQMIFVPGGAMIIDTPGMREVQLWEFESGLSQAFDDIGTLARQCRFRDCLHDSEPGCAVLAAIAAHALEQARLDNWRKLRAEQEFHERKLDVRKALEQKRQWKNIHRAMRHGSKEHEL